MVSAHEVQQASPAGWLAALEEASLARVLANRPDALLAPQPRSIEELGQRLGRAESLVLVLRTLPLPCVQICETAQALGGRASLDELTAFLDDTTPDHAAAVVSWLQVLSDHAVAWQVGHGMIATPEALAAIFAMPLGLGPPLRTLVPELNVDRMRRILQTLGVNGPPTRRTDVIEEFLGVLTDPDTVRGIVATASGAVRRELVALACERAETAPEAWDDDLDEDEAPADPDPYDPAAYQRRAAAATWGAERGLVYRDSWSYGWRMPAEISRALRGADYRAPFTPAPAPLHIVAVDESELVAQASAAVARFADLVLSMIDRLARVPLPALKNGGVGARELAKLARSLGCTEIEVRLCLELAAAIELVDGRYGRYELTERAQLWRATPPADRIAELLTTWWQLPHPATQMRDEDGKALPALKTRRCGGCLAARQNLLETLAELAPGSAVPARQVAARALWRRPFVHVLAEDARAPFASILADAGTLGVIASDALTPLGRALAAGDADTVRRLLTVMLPPANDQALFGADLTAVVTGAPTLAVSRLLDAAADRESRGAATVWRFTPGSIRRALDEGHTAPDLGQRLSEIATSELPQALRYLIGDVGRQHGNLRVATSASVIRSEDEALLKQVTNDRALRKFGFRLLAPTVLAADADATAVLAALRKAGYLPMPDDDAPAPAAAGQAAASSQAPTSIAPLRRAARPAKPHGSAPADPAALAARLLAGPPSVEEPGSPSEQSLRDATAGLTSSEIRMLAHAVDTAGSVTIDYRSNTGTLTRRVITAPELAGDTILAWCELRGDERWFRIDRIQAVSPVG